MVRDVVACDVEYVLMRWRRVVGEVAEHVLGCVVC